MTTLAPSQIEAYERQGFLFPIPVLAADEVARCVAGLDEIEASLGGKAETGQLHGLFSHFRWAYDLVTHPKILDAVESVLGPNLLVWQSSVFAKQPHDSGFISWHQDGTYWGLDSHLVTTAWIALTESSTENGCMRVVAGSQEQPVLPHVDTYAENNLLSRGQEIAVDVQEKEATDIVLRAGEMSLHHVNIVHGSRSNSSNRERIGFAVRYISPAVKPTGRHQPVILARGEDRHGNFQKLSGPPEPGAIEELVAAQLESTRQWLNEITSSQGAYQKTKR